MPRRFRPTRRLNTAMTERGFRRLRRFAAEAGLDEGEALSFLFESFDSVIDRNRVSRRLRQFSAGADACKRSRQGEDRHV